MGAAAPLARLRAADTATAGTPTARDCQRRAARNLCPLDPEGMRSSSSTRPTPTRTSSRLSAAEDPQTSGASLAPASATGASGATDDALRDLASEAAAAIALADEYTDAISAVRRVRPTSPAAEIQQNLLPPRILRIAGAMVAGNVLPGYDIGGDWFDYAENRDCAWIGIADTEGEGAAAASLSRNKATAHVTISCWNGATSAIRWVTCGDHAPILITADGELEVLEGVLPLFGKRNLPLEPGVHERRLVDANASSSSLTPSSTGPRSTARRWDWRACAKLR